MLADLFSILASNRRNGIETECASLNLAILMMWLLSTSITSYYQEIDAEESPTVLGPS